MTKQIAEFYAKLSVDATGAQAALTKFDQGLEKTAQSAKKTGGGISDLAKLTNNSMLSSVASIGLAGAAFGALSGAIAYSIKQAQESQKVDAQLNAVLESTHHAAGLSAQQIDEMALSLSRMSTFDDEAIKSADSLLLTFTQISGEVIPDATKTIVDMSTALGQDLQSSTIQVGKALNVTAGDVTAATTAMTAMRRVGVSFTTQQVEMAKELVKNGDILGYQRFILGELSTEFGGSAAAAANTYEGQIAQLKNELGNLGETIGKGALPALTDFTHELNQSVQTVNANWNSISTTAGNAIRIIQGIGTVGISEVIRKVGVDINKTRDGMKSLTDAGLDTRDMMIMYNGNLEQAVTDTQRAIQYGAAWEKQLNSIGEAANTAADTNPIPVDDLEGNKAFLDVLKNVSAATKDYDQSIADINERFSNAKEILSLYRQRQQELYQQLQSGTITARDYGAQIGELRKNYSDGTFAANEQAKAVEELSSQYQQAQNDIVLSVVAMKYATDGWTNAELDAYLKVGETLGKFDEKTVQTTRNVIKAADDIVSGVDPLGKHLAAAAGGVDALADKSINLQGRFTDAGEFAKDFDEKIEAVGNTINTTTLPAASSLAQTLNKLPPSGSAWMYSFYINEYGTVPAVPSAGANTSNTSHPGGGGRAEGGSVTGGLMYPVNERGMPELLNVGSQQYLMMPPGVNGDVVPLRGEGASAPITVNVYTGAISNSIDIYQMAYKVAEVIAERR